jgi:hypothetical protein
MASKINKLLKEKGIPIIEDHNLNVDNSKYVIIGNYNEIRIKRIYNKIMNGICVRNKRIFTVINKALRKFYKDKKVPGSQKIKIINSPDKYFSIRLVNGGFKQTRPYIVKNKILTGNKTGLKALRDKIDNYNSEFTKFNSFLRKMRSSSSSIKSANIGSVIANLGKKFGANVIQAHYDNDKNSYPMVEISSGPTTKEMKILDTLFKASQLRNKKYIEKIKKIGLMQIQVDDLFHCSLEFNYKSWPLGLLAVYEI